MFKGSQAVRLGVPDFTLKSNAEPWPFDPGYLCGWLGSLAHIDTYISISLYLCLYIYISISIYIHIHIYIYVYSCIQDPNVNIIYSIDVVGM